MTPRPAVATFEILVARPDHETRRPAPLGGAIREPGNRRQVVRMDEFRGAPTQHRLHWMAENLPAGTVVTRQVWDDRLPLPLPGVNPALFPAVSLTPFETDSVEDADDALIDEETLFRIMEALDVDGDGDVSKEEFMVPWMKLFPKLTRAELSRYPTK